MFSLLSFLLQRSYVGLPIQYPKLTQPRLGKRELGRFPTQGSGVPQPWASVRSPFGAFSGVLCFEVVLVSVPAITGGDIYYCLVKVVVESQRDAVR